MRVLARVILLVTLISGPALFLNASQEQHPLLSYVNRPDTAYQWSKSGEIPLPPTGTGIQIEMVSQVWQGIPWKHELDIVRPANVRDGSTVLMLITGGHGDLRTWPLMAQVAEMIGMPVAVLFDIPNQPLFGGKKEDSLIAYTLQQYLKTGDKSWPLLYPMTKSAVRAMDTIQALAAKEWPAPVKRFVVTGASKRGWTTWLTGAVDKRVAGIAPIVYDNLNILAQMKQQRAVYGNYSEKIGSYSSTGLLDMLSNPKGQELVYLVDPFVFRDRLTMPKMIINGSNDRYWTLESANLYFNELPGDKHLYYVPNAGHGLDVDDQLRDLLLGTLDAFASACSQEQTLPQVTWDFRERPDDLRLSIRPEDAPQAVTIWTATAPTKDFRNAQWLAQTATVADGSYTFTLPRPQTGYAAAFGEAHYQKGTRQFTLSTIPKIIGAK